MDLIPLTSVHRIVFIPPELLLLSEFAFPIIKNNDGKDCLEILPQYATWYGMKCKHWTFIHPLKLFNEISTNMLTTIPIALIKLIVEFWAPCLCYCQEIEDKYSYPFMHFSMCDVKEMLCTYCNENLSDISSVPSCEFHIKRA